MGFMVMTNCRNYDPTGKPSCITFHRIMGFLNKKKKKKADKYKKTKKKKKKKKLNY